MYGETVAALGMLAVAAGLSPRVRGNLQPAVLDIDPRRSIPACTGKPHHDRLNRRPCRVYPRVYGETSDASGLQVGDTGLSPRVRGNPLECPAANPVYGSIPACTGKP